MRSKTISFRMPQLLYPMVDKYWRRKGYKDLSAFLNSRCFVALQDERRDIWVRDLANANPKLQDFLVQKMFEWPTDIREMADLFPNKNGRKRKS